MASDAAALVLGGLIERQLGRPSALSARLMNAANARINRGAIALLEPAPDHRVLEVGFGGGGSLVKLAERAAFVAGIDPSEPVVRSARRRFAARLAAGRVEIAQAGVEVIPFPRDSFDGALTVNTIYFWPRPEHGLGELRRVLKPGARLVVATGGGGYRSRSPGVASCVYTEAEQVDLLQDAGFGDVTTVRRGAFVLVLAERV
jgi:SAM-dependent methyltransferase